MSTPPPNYTPLDRDEVISYFGPAWPPTPDAPSLTVPPELIPTDGESTSGAVGVYPTPGRPGTTWWAVDAVIWPQSAGAPDEALAELLPGSVLTVPAPPDPDEPPPSPPLTD